MKLQAALLTTITIAVLLAVFIVLSFYEGEVGLSFGTAAIIIAAGVAIWTISFLLITKRWGER